MHIFQILKSCTSHTELIESLNYVVSALGKGDLQPVVHTDNFTNLGQMVRDAYRGHLTVPVMNGTKPLLYLAEIGLNKLQQDYVSMFLSGSLADMNMFTYYLKGNLELQDRHNRLAKLHNTMETMAMLKRSLSIPQEVLAKSCRQVLKHYETHEIDNGYQFQFSIPTESLLKVVERFTPTEWQADAVKMVGGIPERLVYQMTSEQPFDWLKLEKPDTGAEKSCGDLDDVSYYLTIVKESVSILS